MTVPMDDVQRTASSDASQPDAGPEFDAAFRASFEDLIRWRRDVRRFQSRPLPDGALEDLIGLAALAPSVGLAQPWRYVVVESAAARRLVRANFESANAEALASYDDQNKAGLYARLKLAGLDDAPVQLAVFCDSEVKTGHGLGRRTMPEMLAYSVVTAVHTLWLAARTRGIGVGWVSILDADQLARDLAVSSGWQLVAYLCIGYPQTDSDAPELQRAGWEQRENAQQHVRRI